jgi:hypothetical protein
MIWYDMREQCSKYNIFWFCSENYEVFFIECLILTKSAAHLRFQNHQFRLHITSVWDPLFISLFYFLYVMYKKQ